MEETKLEYSEPPSTQVETNYKQLLRAGQALFVQRTIFFLFSAKHEYNNKRVINHNIVLFLENIYT